MPMACFWKLPLRLVQHLLGKPCRSFYVRKELLTNLVLIVVVSFSKLEVRFSPSLGVLAARDVLGNEETLQHGPCQPESLAIKPPDTRWQTARLTLRLFETTMARARSRAKLFRGQKSVSSISVCKSLIATDTRGSSSSGVIYRHATHHPCLLEMVRA
jgi:hypothetical protein